jgi:pimeloyl-ACP methyl ester carboxylesterase
MRRFICLIVLAVLAAAPGRAQERLGVILMHGKHSAPTDNRSGLPSIASSLESKGYKMIVPVMPWGPGGWEKIGLTVEDVFGLIDGYAATLRSQDAQRIVVGGHSLGANIALSYAVERGGVAGVVMASPGHSPGRLYRSESGRKAIDRAAELVKAGQGGQSFTGPDNNQGQSLTMSTTAAVYASWLNPRGKASMDSQAPRLPATLPLLLVIGKKDPAFGRAKGAFYDPAAKNPYSKYVVVGTDHVQTPFAASKQIVDWIVGLPR